ncbi:hypothetical protein K458DRAFT_307192 [Lentithecium fluviatile CBS 122367]|uniref:Endonuclease/exonuclease/phosphatase domain-containing protein n=1 Tax=Lentithecium fluviatile CBS 122367 TaxID=1168545 RepID=A0A6G1IVP8_9PLEO|nr:hypothetical protein K458DRAFT_307192 [Lentithecium fluviatile CBS 122367]
MLRSLLQKQLSSYTPEIQPFYTFRQGTWQPCIQPGPQELASKTTEPLKSLCLITWNIDFMASQPQARMASALNYLEGLVSGVPSSSGTVIFLQEMMESEGNNRSHDAKDLSQVAAAAWVRQGFDITDVNSSCWDSSYGLVALIDRRLRITNVSRLRFVSEYQRDALFVDIRLASEKGTLLRLCNVHLDSSYGSMRPIQWKAVAKHLQDVDAGIVASIVAGDCNATQPRDRTEPRDNGFTDAYLELGGVEGDEEGLTWGFQSVDWKRWGRKRLDKEAFWGKVKVRNLRRIGVGVEVAAGSAKKELAEGGELPFVTDHYGLMCEYEIEDTLRTT